MDRELPRQDEIWRHFKNKLYRIVAIAQHTETGEQLVVYQAMYGDGGTYARPLDMFMSEVDRDKYPEVEQEYRFVRVE
ncbi:hypothetical protein D081_1205 [Anaerovibrio sp. JC8]|uniref:DUF1653 domain-containing protein n=1 Tax=Anaerovibrio sp. JC8 TaxID=1240085 RepID=UPI000A09FE6E|nr:DUF1653 domain-containing protein [Anaerovibrio sp. JC8]ORU00111.1 hypothetical protein D081_1205 [Anaerovibrio sp. JC8]